MALRIQIAKLKIRQYLLRANSPNLKLTKFSRYTVHTLFKFTVYVAVAYFNFGAISHGATYKGLIYGNCTSNTQDTCMIDKEAAMLHRTKPRLCSAPNERAFTTCNHRHTHLIEFAHASSYYLRVATIHSLGSI